MEEQGKKNLPGEGQAEEQENVSAQQAVPNGEGVSGINPPSGRQDTGQGYGYPQAPNAYGTAPRAPQYGYNPAVPGAAYPQTPYQAGYPQYPQQPYRPQTAGGYPTQQTARPYGAYQQNANGTGPGQYNYKASMQQHNQGSTYTGAGPGQYDFRAAAANATAPKPQTATPNPQQTPAAQTGQAPYGYPNYQQQQYPNYPKPQGAGYGYYPQGQQQYGYPSQYGNVPPGQSYIQFTPQYGYGSNMYNQPRPNQQGGYNAPVQGRPQQPTVSKPQPTVPGQKTKPVAAKPGEPQKTAEKKPVDSEKKPTTLPANGEVVEEIITEDGKKKKIVKRVVKKTPSGRDEKPKADGTPRFVQEQVKEIKERTGEEPIVVVKSKQAKKKPSKEGVYEPSLKDMIFGPPKKDDSDKEADFFEWKCPECGTVNADYVSTCK